MAPKAAAGKADAKAKAKADAKKTAVKKEKKADEPETPKMPEPDQKAHDEALGKIQEKIDDLQKKAQAITAQINAKSAGKDDFFKERAEIKAELDATQNKMNEIKAEKDKCQEMLGAKKAEGAEMKQSLTKMNRSMGYTSEEQIDERIATIEFKMWTDSISLKEEKALLAEIKELKKNKPKLSEITQLKNKVDTFDSGADLKAKSQDLSAQLQALYQQKVGIQERMKDLNEKRKSQVGDVEGEFERRNKIQEQVKEAIAEKNVLKDAFREEMRKYKDFVNQQRWERNQKYLEERKKQEAEWKKQKAQKEVDRLDVNPHLAQVTLIEQTIVFCKGLMPKDTDAEKEEKKETVYNNKDGETVLLTKEARAEEFFFAPTKKKGPKKGKANAAESSSKKPIKHNAETFKLFDSLGLEAPITAADVPPLLEQLDKLMEACQVKVQAFEDRKEEMKKQIVEGKSYDDVVAGEKDDEEADKEEEKEDEKEEEKEEEKDEEPEEAQREDDE